MIKLGFQYFRSIVFYIVYAISGVIAGLVSVFLWPTPFLFRYSVVMLWNHFALWAAKYIAGINYNIIGLENIPRDKAYVVLCKHQSAWETIFTQIYFKPISTILKRELLRIPFFGWGLALLKPVAIDRSKPREAMRKVHTEGMARIKEGINLLVFPEGTRIPFGEIGNYARGGAEIACVTGAPILPVAHNAGALWPVSKILKTPGTLTVVIGKPITCAGRNSKELTEEVKAWIEQQIRLMPDPVLSRQGK
jgi:1-acyl-sn-glycerol-3-phosphate acyltransferase